MSLCPVFCASVVGIPCEIVSPKKVAELHPLLNVHDLVGAMHVPEDAVVSSADVALALASAASQSGEWARGEERAGLRRAAQRRQRHQTASAWNSGSRLLSFCLSAVPVSAVSLRATFFLCSLLGAAFSPA